MVAIHGVQDRDNAIAIAEKPHVFAEIVVSLRRQRRWRYSHADMEPVNLAEYEEAARAKLPRQVCDYYAGGANDEVTLRANREAYGKLSLYHRVLHDVAVRDTSVELLGERISFPVMVAPTAFHRLACADGECATARAAARAGTIMVMSTLATMAIEDVAAAAAGPKWFQLYIYKDRGATADLIRRAELAGCRALVLTVDAQVWGRREADVRNNFKLPDGLTVANLTEHAKAMFPAGIPGSGLAAYVTQMLDPSLSWRDLAWLREQTKLPILLKGIVRADDAKLAVEHGVDGVVVSNHGGRQLDTAPATITALPQVVEAVAGKIPVLIDGGVRRGTDVVKAIALGAQAALIGRPILWGLAADGEEGAYRVLEMLRAEFDLAMALCGARTVREIDRSLVM
jgi:4-hydroxymandelate oxidase